MENNDLLEVSNESLDNQEPPTGELSDGVTENSTDSQGASENEVSEKKTKKKRLTSSSEEVFVKGDRVIVDESQNPEWVNGSQIPHWIYTRRFFVVNTTEDNTCEISLNLEGKISGRISSKFLKKVL